MTPESSAPTPADSLDRLPPVEPPSARFIMQLFVIPFIVVVVLVLSLLVVYGLFGRIATGGRDALEFVQAIRSQNENRRWRAAFELASLIHNEPKLAHDDALQAELAELLEEELNKPPGKSKAEVSQYLALALGSFEIPPERNRQTQGAVNPLATLLKSLEDTQPTLVRIAAVESLSRMVARGPDFARDQELLAALVRASATSDAEIRQRAAYALGYFDLPESRAALKARLPDEDRDVRYNAAAALARLDDTSALPVLREMLSTPDLEAAFSAELKDNPDATRKRIEAIQLEALLTLQNAFERGRTQLSSSLRDDLERLAASAPKPVEIECRNILKRLPSTAQ